jgi:hypothetical protein
MHRPEFFRSGEHALGVELGPEPGDMRWRVMLADGVEGLVPGRRDFAGRGVDVAASEPVPDRQVLAVEADGVGGGHQTWWQVAAMTWRRSARQTVPRKAMWVCGTSVFGTPIDSLLLEKLNGIVNALEPCRCPGSMQQSSPMGRYSSDPPGLRFECNLGAALMLRTRDNSVRGLGDRDQRAVRPPVT